MKKTIIFLGVLLLICVNVIAYPYGEGEEVRLFGRGGALNFGFMSAGAVMNYTFVADYMLTLLPVFNSHALYNLYAPGTYYIYIHTNDNNNYWLYGYELDGSYTSQFKLTQTNLGDGTYTYTGYIHTALPKIYFNVGLFDTGNRKYYIDSYIKLIDLNDTALDSVALRRYNNIEYTHEIYLPRRYSQAGGYENYSHDISLFASYDEAEYSFFNNNVVGSHKENVSYHMCTANGYTYIDCYVNSYNEARTINYGTLLCGSWYWFDSPEYELMKNPPQSAIYAEEGDTVDLEVIVAGVDYDHIKWTISCAEGLIDESNTGNTKQYTLGRGNYVVTADAMSLCNTSLGSVNWFIYVETDECDIYYNLTGFNDAGHHFVMSNASINISKLGILLNELTASNTSLFQSNVVCDSVYDFSVNWHNSTDSCIVDFDHYVSNTDNSPSSPIYEFVLDCRMPETINITVHLWNQDHVDMANQWIALHNLNYVSGYELDWCLTNGSGECTFIDLIAGHQYTVTFTKPGFELASKTFKKTYNDVIFLQAYEEINYNSVVLTLINLKTGGKVYNVECNATDNYGKKYYTYSNIFGICAFTELIEDRSYTFNFYKPGYYNNQTYTIANLTTDKAAYLYLKPLPGKVSFEGYAVNSSGHGLSGVKIVFEGIPGTETDGIKEIIFSGSLGYYNIESITEGTYKITASLPGYIDEVSERKLTGEPELYVIYLTKGENTAPDLSNADEFFDFVGGFIWSFLGLLALLVCLILVIKFIDIV